jgi:hypothetical protein
MPRWRGSGTHHRFHGVSAHPVRAELEFLGVHNAGLIRDPTGQGPGVEAVPVPFGVEFRVG